MYDSVSMKKKNAQDTDRSVENVSLETYFEGNFNQW